MTWRAHSLLVSLRGGASASLLAAAALAMAAGCGRERRDLHPSAQESSTSNGVVVSELRPATGAALTPVQLDHYLENAYALNEGKRLYESYNCSGCHAHGGGSMGPALMDERWIYGSEPANLFATIVEGRPNGMPSFRGKIPDFQVAELVAYVRSMSGLAGKEAAPGRNDAMNVNRAENTRDRLPPVRAEGAPPP
jgi:cytochrome c oxidase cbb3-type subunit 3